MFTMTTYSAFTVSKYLSAATITIAKLNYTLASTTSGYNNGSISVPAGGTTYVDLTLTSLNSIKTKYALNYSSASSNVTVKYSQNIKNNMSGTISTNGSAITMRVVITNSGSTDATVNLSIAGGYMQNDLTTNITQGHYEQDVTVRTTLLDENFANPTSNSAFPANDGNYAYYKTECSETSSPVWNATDWTLNLNNVSAQISCDVYFKTITNDLEIYFMLQDWNGQNGTISTTAPANDGSYVFQKVACSNSTVASWNGTTWKLELSSIPGQTMCMAYFNQLL